jgi:hypothetical protein
LRRGFDLLLSRGKEEEKEEKNIMQKNRHGMARRASVFEIRHSSRHLYGGIADTGKKQNGGLASSPSRKRLAVQESKTLPSDDGAG